MKTFVTFTTGHQEVNNMSEALQVARQNENTNFIVEIDENKLPEDCTADDAIYAAECDGINRTYKW